MNADLVQSMYIDYRLKLIQIMREMNFDFDIETLCNIRRDCVQADFEQRKRCRSYPMPSMPPMPPMPLTQPSPMAVCPTQQPLAQTQLQSFSQLVPMEMDAALRTKSIQVMQIEQMQEQPPPPPSSHIECNQLPTLHTLNEYSDLNQMATILSENETFFGASAALLASAINDSGVGDCDDRVTLDDEGFLHSAVPMVHNSIGGQGHASAGPSAFASNDQEDVLHISNDCEVYFLSSDPFGSDHNANGNLVDLDEQVGHIYLSFFSHFSFSVSIFTYELWQNERLTDRYYHVLVLVEHVVLLLGS